MARVISWKIEDKYVYIKAQDGSYIRDTALSNDSVRALGSEVLGWEESRYASNFNAMRAEVLSIWGSAVDMKSDYRFYYGATDEEGVYMLTGRDGVNTSDSGKAFYNFVIENNNICIGLGGNYILDVTTTLNTVLYLEKDGQYYQPDTITVTENGRSIEAVPSVTSEGKILLAITIPEGEDFSEGLHKNEYVIEVKKGSFTGRGIFTVVGLKDGEEGVSYDLIVNPKTIKVKAEERLDRTISISCRALKNGEEVVNDEHLKIMYNFGTSVQDSDDLSSEYTTPINAGTVEDNDDQVNFYLVFDGKIIDMDSCVIIRDGAGVHAQLELDNEIDGIAVGDDYDLDLEEGETVHVGTGFILYSGGTPLQLTGRIKLSQLSVGHIRYNFAGANEEYDSDWRNVTSTEVDTNTTKFAGATAGKVFFELENGFDFGEDYRDEIKITVWGKNSDNEETSASATYTLLAIKGGKDGSIYRIVANMDMIMVDPNNAEDPYDGPAKLLAKGYLGKEKIDDADITYSLKFAGAEITFEDSYNATTPLHPTNGLNVMNDIIRPEATGVVLYLWTATTEEGHILLDRETIPVIKQGKDAFGAYAKLELDNEIDGVGVGDDMDLDLVSGETVHIDTGFILYSGDTPLTLTGQMSLRGISEHVKIKIGDDTNTDVESDYWEPSADVIAGEPFNASVIGGGTPSQKGHVYFELDDGYDFGEDYRNVIYITVWGKNADDVVTAATAAYIILAVKGGKDGAVYKVRPNVDYVMYDPNNEVNPYGGVEYLTARAFLGVDELVPEPGNVEIRYSVDAVYDGEEYYDFTDMYEGPIDVAEFSGSSLVAFYLWVNFDDEMLMVDRETVPVIKQGLNGEGSVKFDLTNLFEIINTGSDVKLDIPGETRSYSTVAFGYSGSTTVPIEVEIVDGPSPFQHCTVTTSSTSDNGVVITVTLEDQFDFTAEQRRVVDITAMFASDNNRTRNLSYTLISIMNGDAADEGDSYRLRTNVPSVVFDGAEWSPASVSAAVYLGSQIQACDVYFIYSDTEFSIEEIMDKSTYADAYKVTYEGDELAATAVNIVNNIVREGMENKGTIYVAAFDSEDRFLDAENIIVMIDEGAGAASGVIADLTDDIGVIATGDNEKLENTEVTLTTTLFAREGLRTMFIKQISLPAVYRDAQGNGTITFAAPTFVANTNTTQVDITITVDTTNDKYIDFHGNNPVQFTIACTATTSEDTDMGLIVGYSLLGLKGGKDGQTVKLVLNSNQITYDSNMELVNDNLDRFSPSEIWAKLYIGDDDITSADGITFEVKNSDMADEGQTEMWLDFDEVKTIDGEDYAVFDITEDNLSEYYPVTVRALSGRTLMDWETVQVLRTGKDGSGSSPFRLDLDNQNASINCDSGGTILNDAVRPECIATLYYGGDPATEVGSVTYSIEIDSRYSCRGVTTALTADRTGMRIIFANNSTLSWNGTTLQIVAKAMYSEDGTNYTLKGRAVMNVSKNLASKDGEPAVSYWLAPSHNAVRVDSGGTATPSAVSCVAWKQVGGETPVQLTSGDIKIYSGYNTDNPSTVYTAGSNVTIDTGRTYLTFILKGNNIQYDIETIPILHDGSVGETVQGRQGAAVLGPTKWEPGMTRRWHSGNENVAPGHEPLQPEDLLFLDIIIKGETNDHKPQYWYCNASYTQSASDTWVTVSNYWTAAEEQFDFIATNLLLAPNAKINFLTNNEIYLMNPAGTIVTGGARGASRDDDIIFWAGSDNPSDAPFQVDYQGNLIATSGVFSGFIRMPYVKLSQAYSRNGSGDYTLDTNHSYIILDQAAGSSNLLTVYLPTPTEALNGFAYNFISVPGATRNDRLYTNIMVQNNAERIANWSAYPHESYVADLAGQAILGAGFYQIVCISGLHSYPTWVILQATGNIILTDSNFVMMDTWQTVRSNTVDKIQRTYGSPANFDGGTLYFEVPQL